MIILTTKEIYSIKYSRKVQLDLEEILTIDGKKTKWIPTREPNLDTPIAMALLLAAERLKQLTTECIIDDVETADNFETSISNLSSE